MRNVTDEVSNPFGMRPPCPHACDGGDRRAVFGFGDANARFHVVGDHPGVHGGARTGVPFTGSPASRVWDVLVETGFAEREGDPSVRSCFLSYLYLCCVPDGKSPTPEAYAAFERFFDAELRAIAADVLLPVGERAARHVIEEYTARAGRIEFDMDALHASEIPGQGFLVVPMAEPAEWTDEHEERIVEAVEYLIETGYRQMSDLGRFGPGGEPYFVR